jgi:hypothetical protein
MASEELQKRFSSLYLHTVYYMQIFQLFDMMTHVHRLEFRTVMKLVSYINLRHAFVLNDNAIILVIMQGFSLPDNNSVNNDNVKFKVIVVNLLSNYKQCRVGIHLTISVSC